MKRNSLLRIKPGTQTEIDHKLVGCAVTDARMKRSVPQKKLAKILGVSASFLSDLERGNRLWTEDRIHAVEEAL